MLQPHIIITMHSYSYSSRQFTKVPNHKLENIGGIAIPAIQTFQVPKMEESSPIQVVCKAYVRENPSPK